MKPSAPIAVNGVLLWATSIGGDDTACEFELVALFKQAVLAPDIGQYNTSTNEK